MASVCGVYLTTTYKIDFWTFKCKNFNGFCEEILNRVSKQSNGMTVISEAKVYQKWPEEKQEKIPERQSRRPSPDLREPDFSSPLGGTFNIRFN